MLETVSRGFNAARERLRGVRALTDENIDQALRDVRASLLEADVDLNVVKGFLERVRARALGEKVETRVRDAAGRELRATPGQHFVAICEQELTTLMGPVDPSLARGAGGVVSVLLLGLQGVGKTTVAAKLARLLSREGRRPLLVAADVYRPAAVLQLEQLGAQIGVAVHVGAAGEDPPAICAAASARARTEGFDAIVYDTAGRLAIDEALMQELEQNEVATKPANRLLVCDALMGRDAVQVAKAFSERLRLDGLILTKFDGDARGGAALAVKAVTGVPIKFLGTGETLDRLEPFRPEGLASRILGMGDVVGLVRDFEAVVDQQEAEAAAERMLRGRFTMQDLLDQLKAIQRMGPLREIFGKLPGLGSLADQLDERELVKVEAMIRSMTPLERAEPETIQKSRAARIARGSGRRSKEVVELVQRFRQMREMMGALGGGGGLLSRIPGLGRLAGAGAPAGFDPRALLSGAPGGGSAAAAGGGNARRDLGKRRAQQKRKRKQARKDRRKGRRR
ncbi:MAG TPA: signal recognition particle receptor subunit alpha [Myxococcota bacterium]|nr:signal recognition particle receptor subunit alpha [Myxococcota bacterium]